MSFIIRLCHLTDCSLCSDSDKSIGGDMRLPGGGGGGGCDSRDSASGLMIGYSLHKTIYYSANYFNRF